MILSVERTTRAIQAGLGDGDPNPERMLAAIEGAIMGACYVRGAKVDAQFITINALASLVEGVERHQRGKALGLEI